jgi:hypothetical protein
VPCDTRGALYPSSPPLSIMTKTSTSRRFDLDSIVHRGGRRGQITAPIVVGIDDAQPDLASMRCINNPCILPFYAIPFLQVVHAQAKYNQ